MPNIKSAKKRVIVASNRNERNKDAKSTLKTVLKKANTAVAEDKSAPAVKVAVKSLDKAACKGIIHKNKAARLKSQLAKKVNAPA